MSRLVRKINKRNVRAKTPKRSQIASAKHLRRIVRAMSLKKNKKTRKPACAGKKARKQKKSQTFIIPVELRPVSQNNIKRNSPIAPTGRRGIKKITEPLTFGLLEKEIQSLLTPQELKQPIETIEQTLIQELTTELPKQEKVSEYNTGDQADIIIQDTSEKPSHSPFVLDINAILEQKKKQENKKTKILSFLNINNAKRTAKKSDKIFLPQANRPDYQKQFTKTLTIYHFNLPFRWQRSLITFILLAAVIILPIKVFGYYRDLKQTQNQVVNYALTAYEDLKLARQSLEQQNLESANKNFKAANYNFSMAAVAVDGINASIKSILKVIPTKGANLADASSLLNAGQTAADLGKNLTLMLKTFSAPEPQYLTQRLTGLKANLEKIIPKLDTLNNDLNKVRPAAIPTDKQATFGTIQKYLSWLSNDVKDLNSLTSSINQILGADYKRRYLFVFQNNNEIRPTGGFMGSLALVDIDRGKIVNLEIPGGGTYDFQGSLLTKRVSPAPLHLVNSLWEMQDANWFPDFPTSAQKIQWFYENAGGPSVDGVIAINVSLIPKLLDIVGPLNLPAYGKNLTAANFTTEIQKNVEFEYDKTKNKPKQILADLAPELIKKLFASAGPDLIKVAQTFKQGLDEKEIQLYFNQEGIQSKLQAYGWTGELKTSSKDYLAVINANIGGYKTDAYIQQKINVVSNIQPNGEIINTLTITRTHTGTLQDVFGSKSNVDYVRVYTPLGSQLLSAEGFSTLPADKFEPTDPAWKQDEALQQIQGKIWTDPASQTQINHEFNKTVFGNWMQTNPGQSQTSIITYKLPFHLDLQAKKSWLSSASASEPLFHSLFLQKQSGQQNAVFNVTVNLPNGKTLKSLYPNSSDSGQTKLTWENTLTRDQLLALLIQ